MMAVLMSVIDFFQGVHEVPIPQIAAEEFQIEVQPGGMEGTDVMNTLNANTIALLVVIHNGLAHGIYTGGETPAQVLILEET